ncbi:MAG: hypothetical protein AABY15_00760 [Nanoarchaeota archaeon]
MAINLDAGWVIVGIIVAVVFIVVALVQKRQSMATGMVKIGAIFIVLSIGYVFIINRVQFNSFSSIIDGTKIYFNWMISIFDRVVDITSYAIKQDWVKNSTVGK